jgi:hypothetical protein
MRRAVTMGTRALAALALLLLVGLCVLRSSVGTRLDSFTVDEPWHIVAGAAYLRSGDFNLNPEHPPLVKLWAGASMPHDFRLRRPTALSEKTQERTWVEQTMFEDNDPVRAQADSRAGMWAFHGVLLLVLALLLWRACGWVWAVGTLVFLALEPTVGAHLPVVMTDLPLGLTLAVSAVAAGLLAANWQWRWVGGFGVALGLTLAAKHSALAGSAGIVGALAIAAAIGWRDGGWRSVFVRAAKLACACALAIGVVWALYGFHFHAGVDGSDAFNRSMPDKLAELKIGYWREGIAFADRWHLLPRAYLWGLADTVRTGVEGRGISDHFVWGTTYMGQAPWFTWPAVLLAKLPLALLALAALGAVLLARARLASTARWTLWVVLGASAFHLLALMGSSGVWGGVRHAMPLIVMTSLLGGAALALAWQRRSRGLIGVVALLFAAAFATTIGTPRLWEYHNELVGGSEGAYRYFSNEGLDLGQRFGEIRAFHDRVIAPTGLPMYSDYWMGEEQMRAAGLHYHRRVESLDDTNVAGIYAGYFVYPMHDTLPQPAWDWDPKEVFKELTLVARFGNAGVWQGRQVRPQTRARSLYVKVEDYIYKENGSDWPLVAQRLEEVAQMRPQAVNASVELGNAYLRMGDGPHAIQAYRRPLDQDKMPVDALIRQQLEAQIARVAASDDPSKLELLRNPWLE